MSRLHSEPAERLTHCTACRRAHKTYGRVKRMAFCPECCQRGEHHRNMALALARQRADWTWNGALDLSIDAAFKEARVPHHRIGRYIIYPDWVTLPTAQWFWEKHHAKEPSATAEMTLAEYLRPFVEAHR